MLNIGAGEDSDKPTVSFSAADYTGFTIANSDENEESETAQVKVQPSPVDDDHHDKPTGPDTPTMLNIGSSDPAVQ